MRITKQEARWIMARRKKLAGKSDWTPINTARTDWEHKPSGCSLYYDFSSGDGSSGVWILSDDEIDIASITAGSIDDALMQAEEEIG